jgi:hypothetical protein
MNDKLLYHDSETLKHINEVRENLWLMIRELDERAQIHDQSKLQSPEREVFAEYTQELIKTEYGSPEYQELLKKVQPAIDHHYSKNRHHPEWHKNGISDMNLLDILEMVADWRAATKRNKNGNIRKSIEHNAKRFNINPQLEQILLNTVKELFKD